MDYIHLCDQENKTIAKIDLNDEESLTLDTWKSLLISHAQQKKNLIIASVTASSEGKDYTFHYLASAINRLVFRTLKQTSDKEDFTYLLRLKIKNPLTNNEIKGNISYYSLKCDQDQAFEIAPRRNSRTLYYSSLHNIEAQLKNEENRIIETCAKLSDNLPIEEQQEDFESNKDSKTLLIASFIGDDKDFLMNANFRSYMLAQAIDEEDSNLLQVSLHSLTDVRCDQENPSGFQDSDGSDQEFILNMNDTSMPSNTMKRPIFLTGTLLVLSIIMFLIIALTLS